MKFSQVIILSIFACISADSIERRGIDKYEDSYPEQYSGKEPRAPKSSKPPKSSKTSTTELVESATTETDDVDVTSTEDVAPVSQDLATVFTDIESSVSATDTADIEASVDERVLPLHKPKH